MQEKLLPLMLQLNSELSQTQDIDTLLDRILHAARKYTNADAGTIYLASGNQLTARFVQNDTLGQRNNRDIPVQNSSFPINQKTISGYAASTGKIVQIKDVYNLPANLPFKFSSIFDESTNYRSVSMLVAPIKSSQNNILGVIQVINKLSPDKNITAFAQDDTALLSQLSSLASLAIQRTQFIHNIVLRMVSMIQLHDPEETPMHVSCVADCSVELYRHWAVSHSISDKKIVQNTDLLRLASLLHDIGKIAIPTSILSRQYSTELLSEEEQSELESHTWRGAQLFASNSTAIDALVRTISITHHECWDGSGYPGYVDIKTGTPIQTDKNGKALRRRADDIPISGRIAAITDRFDTVYNQTKDESEAFATVKNGSGTDFDPELCSLFGQIMPAIRSIYAYHKNQQLIT